MFSTQVKPPVRPMKPDAMTPSGLYRPATRGDLAKALSEPEAVTQIAPESPRPAEMLEGVELRQMAGFALTADDEILHDLLASWAYAGDRAMPEAMHTLSVADAVRYLNSATWRSDAEGKRGEDDKRRPGGVERGDVIASLRRLKLATVSYGGTGGRRYSEVSLLEFWCESSAEQDVIRYRLPAPIRDLLATQPRYAYLELAALPAMSSKYSLRLYKKLALAAAGRKWEAGQDNRIVLSPTPAEFAAWIGYPLDADGTVKPGKLKERVLGRIADDFRKVQAFEATVTPRKGPGRGRGGRVEAIDIEIRLRAPDRRAVRCFFRPSEDPLRPGDKDVEKYRVESRTMRRAHKVFGRALRTTHARDFADLWQVALSEALSGELLTDGYASRSTRGQALLSTVDARGADYAAWALFEQEAEDPDLMKLNAEDRLRFRAAEKAAHEARYDRLGEEAPRGVRKQAPVYIVDEDTGTPPPQPSRPVPEMTLEDCNAVTFEVDPACGDLEVGDIGAWISKHTYTGTRRVDVILRYGAHAHELWKVGRYAVSEDDVDAILKRFRTALELEEYE